MVSGRSNRNISFTAMLKLLVILLIIKLFIPEITFSNSNNILLRLHRCWKKRLDNNKIQIQIFLSVVTKPP